MTIESHYNKLRSTALSLRALANGDFGDVPHDLRLSYRDRIIECANHLATQDWPRLRAELATRGESLTEGPPHFGTTGYGYTTVAGSSICSGMLPSDCPKYVGQACEQLSGELALEANAAELAYERYRAAVSQGVAIDPEQGGL